MGRAPRPHAGALAFAGPFVGVTTQELWPPTRTATFCIRVVLTLAKSPDDAGIGFVPNEAPWSRPAYSSPARTPVARSGVRESHSVAANHVRSPGCGKTLHADPESSHSRGYAPDFSCYGVAPEGQHVERHVHAGDARAGRDYGASLGTKPIPASSGLFADFRDYRPQDVFACVGGQTSCDCNRAKGPAKSAHRLQGRPSLDLATVREPRTHM